MDQLDQKHKLLQLAQCEIDNLNSPITMEEIKFIITKLVKKKSLGSDDITGDFYKTCKEELTIILQLISSEQKWTKCFLIHFMKPVLLLY